MHPPGSSLPSSERYTTRIFEVYYESDAVKFKEKCEKVNAYFRGCVSIPYLNAWNEENGMRRLVCIYQYKEDIDMEVKC